MSLTNPNTPVSQQDLQDFYHKILPYMGDSFAMIANKFSKGDLYSTDEKMIGQWIDGKPLYQKVIYQTNVNNFTPNVDIDMGLVSDDLEYGHFVLVETNAGGLNPGWNYGGGTYRSIINIFVRQANKHLIVQFARADISEFTAVLQYTKTTDSAISIGSDTDYSTEEKIVGTWIDGKPIYQRSYNLGTAITVSPTTWTATGLNISSVENLIQCQGNNVGLSCPLIGTKAGDNTLKVVTTRAESSLILYITIQYTKTT